jgi:hypothetical protein
MATTMVTGERVVDGLDPALQNPDPAQNRGKGKGKDDGHRQTSHQCPQSPRHSAKGARRQIHGDGIRRGQVGTERHRPHDQDGQVMDQTKGRDHSRTGHKGQVLPREAGLCLSAYQDHLPADGATFVLINLGGIQLGQIMAHKEVHAHERQIPDLPIAELSQARKDIISRFAVQECRHHVPASLYLDRRKPYNVADLGVVVQRCHDGVGLVR